MTDISVSQFSYQVEKRSWLLGEHGTEPGSNPTCTLAVSLFTAATHYPNGYIPSGTLLAQVTAAGATQNQYGPYDDSLTNGQQVAAGILFSSVRVVRQVDGSVLSVVGGALFVHGFVRIGRLPIANGATGRGYYDAAAAADLKLIHFVA